MTIPSLTLTRPQNDEYSSYLGNYVSRVIDADIMALLKSQTDELKSMLRDVSDDQAMARPAPGEWNIKEVVSHLNDAERIFSYRALRFSRQDATPLPGFDQDEFAKYTNASDQTLGDLLEEFTHLRSANVLFFKSMTPEMQEFRGTASNVTVTPRALVYVIVGHVDHHIESLKTVYLP